MISELMVSWVLSEFSQRFRRVPSQIPPAIHSQVRPSILGIPLRFFKRFLLGFRSGIFPGFLSNSSRHAFRHSSVFPHGCILGILSGVSHGIPSGIIPGIPIKISLMIPIQIGLWFLPGISRISFWKSSWKFPFYCSRDFTQVLSQGILSGFLQRNFLRYSFRFFFFETLSAISPCIPRGILPRMFSLNSSVIFSKLILKIS